MPSAFPAVNSFTFTPAGVARNTSPEKLVYPNPCNDKLFVDIPSGTNVSVFDSHGILILDGLYADGIDVSKLPTGLYFAKIRTNTRLYRVSFLKK